MKNTILSLLVSGAMLAACGGTTTEKQGNNTTVPTADAAPTETEKTGQFSFDGQTYTGAVSTQYLDNKPDGKFSVLCQQNLENNEFMLFQIVFPTEAEAAAEGSFTPAEGFYSLEKGEAHVAVSGYGKIGDKEYTTHDKSTGSIAVKNRTLTISNLQVFTSDGKTKTVDANISY